MTALSPLMIEKAGLMQGSTAHDLIAKIEQDNIEVLDGILKDQESRTSALESLNDIENYSLEIIRCKSPKNHRFTKLILQDQPHPILIGLIGEMDIVSPPTNLENLIFWASIDTRIELHSNWIDKDGKPVVNWREATRGTAIIAIPRGVEPTSLRRLLAAIFSLEHAELPTSTASNNSLEQATEITLRNEPEAYSNAQTRLIFEAVSETNPKWRCLSFYRILENAYLTNIKRILNTNFDFDAKNALNIAVKSVSSEVQQLLTLSETVNLRREFIEFNSEIDNLITAQNKFIEALDRGAREDRELYGHQEIWRKGVLRFYKLRCSIAHGGTSSVIYEQFPDANSAAIALLESIEKIAFKSLSLEIIS